MKDADLTAPCTHVERYPTAHAEIKKNVTFSQIRACNSKCRKFCLYLF